MHRIMHWCRHSMDLDTHSFHIADLIHRIVVALDNILDWCLVVGSNRTADLTHRSNTLRYWRIARCIEHQRRSLGPTVAAVGIDCCWGSNS